MMIAYANRVSSIYKYIYKYRNNHYKSRAGFEQALFSILCYPVLDENSHNLIELNINQVGADRVQSCDCINFDVGTNPCPCGYYPDMSRCSCSKNMISKYLSRISYPLLDRMDLSVEVPEVKYQDLSVQDTNLITTAYMKEKVELARMMQKERYHKINRHYNSELSVKEISLYCHLSGTNQKLLENAYEQMHLSMRSLHKIIKISRTIADLAGEDEIREEHIAEAFSYRNIRMNYW